MDNSAKNSVWFSVHIQTYNKVQEKLGSQLNIEDRVKVHKQLRNVLLNQIWLNVATPIQNQLKEKYK